jgi:hypothetical protein
MTALGHQRHSQHVKRIRFIPGADANVMAAHEVMQALLAHIAGRYRRAGRASL